jgi:PAS domain S-box-containing protein
MNHSLRVLIVDDSEEDAILIARMLKHEGYDLTTARVDSAEGMRSSLVEQPWDLVIAAYAMPRFSGLAAIQLLHEISLDIPIILVSGSPGEEVAVDAMKAGANDYVMQGNLARLVPAVRRELQESYRRRSQRVAEEQLRKLSYAVEQSPIVVIITDAGGRIDYVNPRFHQLTGYTMEEVRGKSAGLMKSGYAPKSTYEAIWKTIRSGREWNGELQNRKKDGSLYWVSVSISPIYDQSGTITHFIAVEEDITERKQDQAERTALLDGMRYLNVDLRRRADELAVITRVSREIISTRDLSQVFTSIARHAAEFSNSDATGVFAFREHAHLYIAAGYGVSARFLDGIEHLGIAPGQPGIGQAASEKRPIQISNIAQTENNPLAAAYAEEGICALLAVPMMRDQDVIGEIVLWHREFRNFSPQVIAFIQALAQQCVHAVENARLFEAEARRRSEAETLYTVAQALSATLDLPRVFELLLSELQKVVPYDSASVQQLQGDQLVIIGGRGFPNLEELLHITFSVVENRNPNQRVVEQRKPVILDNPAEVYSDFSKEPHAQANIHSWLGVPLIFGDRTIGMIALDKQESGFYTEAHARMAQAFAAQAAIAIENARLFAQEERRASEYARALEQQQELDRLKDQFIQNVSHELRTPMAIARGYAELLEADELGPVPPQQREPIAIIARRLRMLSHLVDDINAILEVETKEPDFEWLDLGKLVQAVGEDFRVSTTAGGISLTMAVDEGLPPIRGDIIHLRRMLDNLLGNALKFTPEGGQICVRLKRNTTHLLVEVADTGIGIPAEKRGRIFERFYQVDGSMRRRYGGTGLGLAIVRQIAELHAGTVDVDSEVGKGSTFCVSLPFGQVG